MTTPDRGAPAVSGPQRVLACVLCQQRKVKCDRKFPCANCVRSQAQCVPAAMLAPRKRRRRFPERELLDRLRGYETLLRQNNIEFEPLHQDSSTVEQQALPASGGDRYVSPDVKNAGLDRSSSPSTTSKHETAKNIWNAMDQKSLDSDDDSSDISPHEVREAVLKAWSQVYQNNDHLLFGSRNTAVDISTLHPEQGHIFRLWQIYLDNVNPLLKVTHTPTLQGRIIEAASNVANINPNLIALMFGIYCVSILSLDDDECHVMFGSPRGDLLTRYQFGCQQALLNCEFLRSSDRESLTALYLYLLSARGSTDPQSLSSLLGLAIRIAQRMGLHSESAYSNCLALEAEMRRRLWWSLVLFDTRIFEMVDYKSMLLVPTWDCRIPLNLNDFDIQPEMKDPPPIHERSTEALFTVVRSEMGDFIRNSAFHLDFIMPALKAVAKDVQGVPVPEGCEMVGLERLIREKYLKHCNPENPLHFMTIWTARYHLAKNRLVEIFSRHTGSSAQHTNPQRDIALFYALEMLECDTKLAASPLTKGFLWFTQFHFPFPAYMHILQDLRRRAAGDNAERVWKTMNDNYEARFSPLGPFDEPFFKIFATIVLQAWEARETLDNTLMPPLMVSDIKQRMAHPAEKKQNAGDMIDMGIDNFSMPMPVDFGGQDMFYGMNEGQVAPDLDVNQLDWNAMSWNPMHGQGWGV